MPAARFSLIALSASGYCSMRYADMRYVMRGGDARYLRSSAARRFSPPRAAVRAAHTPPARRRRSFRRRRHGASYRLRARCAFRRPPRLPIAMPRDDARNAPPRRQS